MRDKTSNVTKVGIRGGSATEDGISYKKLNVIFQQTR